MDKCSSDVQTRRLGERDDVTRDLEVNDRVRSSLERQDTGRDQQTIISMKTEQELGEE